MHRLRPLRARGALIVLLCLVAGCGDNGEDTREVTLALDFTPNAAHAGVYSASETDADRREGIELGLRAPGASTDSLKLL
jgi:ABC-type nitrate/sulfonate/bicarbonate transport system substrate-binding protein